LPRPGGEKCPPGVATDICPLPQSDEWRGPSPFTFVARGQMSSSRLGPPSLDLPSTKEFAGQPAIRAVDRVSRTSQTAVELGVSTSLTLQARKGLAGQPAIRAVDRVSRTSQTAVELGVSASFGGIAGLSGDGTYSNGDTFSDTDMLDMNGDGFPDILGSGGI